MTTRRTEWLLIPDVGGPYDYHHDGCYYCPNTDVLQFDGHDSERGLLCAKPAVYLVSDVVGNAPSPACVEHTAWAVNDGWVESIERIPR